ncbi:hypothetical protein ccbrp13_46790 [Ktedonobacteria bacterium brp13]|nr:hypothetical protein ccbrp13_46790 [Ktedonobacteria bacterium brp13]
MWHKAQFGISYSESLVQNRALNLPLVSVAGIFQHNTSGLVTLKSSGLDSIAKLDTYAAEHPEEAVKILIASAPKGTFPNLKEIETSQEYNSSQYLDGSKCWGEQTLQMWTNYPRFMYTHQAVLDAAGKPITTQPNYAASFTDSLLPVCK